MRLIHIVRRLLSIRKSRHQTSRVRDDVCGEPWQCGWRNVGGCWPTTKVFLLILSWSMKINSTSRMQIMFHSQHSRLKSGVEMDWDRRQSAGYEYLCHLQVIQFNSMAVNKLFLKCAHSGGEAVDGGVHQGGAARHHGIGGGAQERGHLGQTWPFHGTNSCPTQVAFPLLIKNSRSISFIFL